MPLYIMIAPITKIPVTKKLVDISQVDIMPGKPGLHNVSSLTAFFAEQKVTPGSGHNRHIGAKKNGIIAAFAEQPAFLAFLAEQPCRSGIIAIKVEQREQCHAVTLRLFNFLPVSDYLFIGSPLSFLVVFHVRHCNEQSEKSQNSQGLY